MRYRDRVYHNYVTSDKNNSIDSRYKLLKNREATLRGLIKNYFPINKSSIILDIGCGYGALIYFARKMGYLNIEGIDGSEQQVKLAEELKIDGVRGGDLFNELRSISNDSLDVVIAFDVIEHLTRDELLSLLDLVKKILVPGGRWIIHAPNGRSPFFGSIRYGDFTHETAFTEGSLNQILRSSGFSEIHFYESRPLLVDVKSFIRFTGWQIIRLMMMIINAIETGSFEYQSVWTRNMYAISYKPK